MLVPGWPTPKGYANGRIGSGRGRVLHIGGQIGWDPSGAFPVAATPAEAFVAQFAQTLDNVLAVVLAAGGDATTIASMTVYVTDMDLYRNARKELAAVWRARLGTHFPAMALVAVSALFERAALVEIQAVAHLGDPP